jgi:hypothetical protein
VCTVAHWGTLHRLLCAVEPGIGVFAPRNHPTHTRQGGIEVGVGLMGD